MHVRESEDAPAESTQESQARRWERAREEGHPRPEERVRNVDISEKPREISISLWARSEVLEDGKEEK